jgi:hypothetical protein
MSTIAIPDQSEFPHRREPGKSVAKTLHPSAFVIHRNDQRRAAQRMNLSGQFLQLLTGLEIAAEQDDAANQRMQQAFAVFRIEFCSSDIKHHRS